jgi:MoxR-like ATPase
MSNEVLSKEVVNAIEPLEEEIDYHRYENNNYRAIILEAMEAIQAKFLEREELTRITILAFFAQKNIFLIGKPGVAKTAFCKIIASLIPEYKFWEMQFSKGTKEKDLYVKQLFKGTTIATSQVLFLDELFKSEGSLLNKMLPVMNERYVTVKGKAIPIQAKTVIAASNEIPDSVDLEPFNDRFHFRFEVVRIRDIENRRAFITGKYNKDKTLPYYFSIKEAQYIKEKSLEVEITKSFQDKYLKLMEKTIKEGLKCTDRKYGHAIEILKMSAFLNGRNYLNSSDIFIFKDIGWVTFNERGNLKRILFELMFGNKIEIQEKLSKIEAELERVSSTKDSDYKEFLHYDMEFNGRQKELIFNKVKEDINTLHIYYNNFLDEVSNIFQKYNDVLEIEEEISENIFLIGIKNKVFTEDVLSYMEALYLNISQNKQECEEWLYNNRTLYDYEEHFYDKHEKAVRTA